MLTESGQNNLPVLNAQVKAYTTLALTPPSCCAHQCLAHSALAFSTASTCFQHSQHLLAAQSALAFSTVRTCFQHTRCTPLTCMSDTLQRSRECAPIMLVIEMMASCLMFACVCTYLVEEVTTVVQQPVQHQNGIRHQGSGQAKAVSKLLSSGPALSSTAQVLLPQNSSNCHAGEIGLTSAQQGPGLAAVGSCALLSLEETQVCLHGAATQVPACRHRHRHLASKQRAGGERQALGIRHKLLYAGHIGRRDNI